MELITNNNHNLLSELAKMLKLSKKEICSRILNKGIEELYAETLYNSDPAQARIDYLRSESREIQYIADWAEEMNSLATAEDLKDFPPYDKSNQLDYEAWNCSGY